MSEAAGKPGWAFVSGMLTVNSGVHLAAAAAGQDTFTPLAGYSSGSKANAIWGGMNLVGGLALARWAIPSGQGWGAEGRAFDAGAALFAIWLAVSERVLGFNASPSAVS